MEDVKHAYEILGVTPTMSLEEIENVYECLVDDFLKQNHDSSQDERLLQWAEAFECIVESRIDLTACSVKENRGQNVLIILLKVVAVIIFSCILIKEISWLEQPDPSPVGGVTTDELSNNFELVLSKFDETSYWDWGYYEQKDEWTVVVAIKVLEASAEGALVSAYNFKLGDDSPVTTVSKDVYKDEEINHLHYLGKYSELVPQSHKFAITFSVSPFMPGEQRILYYEFPNGRKIEVGRLKLENMNDHEDHGILV